MFFKGAKLTLIRNVGSHMQVTHTVNLNDAKSSSYHFAPTYGPCFFYNMSRVVGKFQPAGKPSGSYPVLLGDVGSDGSLVAQVIHEPLANLRLKFQGQAQQRKWLGAQWDAEYSGPDYTVSAKAANVNPEKGTGILCELWLWCIFF